MQCGSQYRYFVSYVYPIGMSTGFGNCIVALDTPLERYEDFEKLSRKIKASGKAGDHPVILNFVPLGGEKIAAK